MRLTKTKKRTILFLTLLLVITVGYALLSQTLDINGTTNIKKSNWSIIWDNVVVNENSVKGESVTTAAAITNTEKTLVEYSISLSEPGEFYEFTVDAKNEGTIDGMVNVVSNKVYQSNGTTERELPEYLTYTVTYSNGEAIKPKHLLPAGTTKKYKVRVEFKDVAADKLPTENETLKFKFEVEYVQADDSAQDIRITGTRYTTNLYQEDSEGNWIENSSVCIGRKPTDNITLYNTVAEAKNAFNNRPIYLKHELENDIVKESYVCFERNSNTYCLRGGINESSLSEKPIYESNKTILKQAFGESNCTQKSFNFYCGAGGLNAAADEYGDVTANDGSVSCGLTDSGCFNCFEW